MEEWKYIKGYEGIYQISNKGRVRTFRVKDGFVGFRICDSPRIMATIPKDNGYRYVTLMKDGKKHNKYVHRLVAEAFIGEIPEGYVINHIDFDKSNNIVTNLEIVTQKQNVLHSKHKMKHPRNISEYKYICLRAGNKFEVTVNKKYLGRFATLDEAKSVRDAYIKKINYY